MALVNDYEVVLIGIAHMFDHYTDRVKVVEIDASRPVSKRVDIALYDNFGQTEPEDGDLEALVANPYADRVAVYTWNFGSQLVDRALSKGVDGYLSKALSASDLVSALERIHRGETVISQAPSGARISVGQDWPGRTERLTEREAGILSLITQGKSNAEIAELTYLSPNTIKTYIRTTYRKIEVTSRTQAVLWGVDHGFKPDHHRIDSWRQPT